MPDSYFSDIARSLITEFSSITGTELNFSDITESRDQSGRTFIVYSLCQEGQTMRQGGITEKLKRLVERFKQEISKKDGLPVEQIAMKEFTPVRADDGLILKIRFEYLLH